MRCKPDARLGRRKAERFAQVPRQEWIVRRPCRPRAFIQAAEDNEIAPLQTRFQRSPDRQPRMIAALRRRDAPGQQRRDQARNLRRRDGAQRIARFAERFQELVRRRAGFAGPDRARAYAVGRSGASACMSLSISVACFS
jgi:hypothetical protein